MHPIRCNWLAPAWLALGCALGATSLAQAAPPGEPPGQAKKRTRDEHPPARHPVRAGERPAQVPIGGFFGDRERDAARAYYHQQYPRSCPPGLAKKNNGCLPPGQAKKYELGRRLPRDVVVYPVSPGVLVHLPPVPVGYEYVRVAGDILLIAIGTHIVVDAVSDLMRR